MNFVPRLFVWVSEGPHILELLHILRHHVGIGLPADFFTAGIGPTTVTMIATILVAIHKE